MPTPSATIEHVSGIGWEYRLVDTSGAAPRVICQRLGEGDPELPIEQLSIARDYFYGLANYGDIAVDDLRLERRHVQRWMVQGRTMAVSADLPAWEDCTPDPTGVDLWPYVQTRVSAPGYDTRLPITPGVPYLRAR